MIYKTKISSNVSFNKTSYKTFTSTQLYTTLSCITFNKTTSQCNSVKSFVFGTKPTFYVASNCTNTNFVLHKRLKSLLTLPKALSPKDEKTEGIKIEDSFGSPFSFDPYNSGSFEGKETRGGSSKEQRREVPKMMYTSYSKLSEVKLLTIGIASPLRILQWAEKTLPNGKIYGEVLNANTLHHKTFKPQKGGLFCERIFGPLKDFECACGKIDKSVKQDFSNSLLKSSTGTNLTSSTQLTSENEKSPQLTQNTLFNSLKLKNDNKVLSSNSNRTTQLNVQIRKFCPVCDVEYTWSVIRRYQLGYIKLISPVTHLWFLKGTPSYLSLLLDIKKRHLQFVTYCSETLTLENSLSQNTKSMLMDSPSKIFESWKTIMEKRAENYSEMDQVENIKKDIPFFPYTEGVETDKSYLLKSTKQDTNLNTLSNQLKFKKSKRILKEAISNKEWKTNNFLSNLSVHKDKSYVNTKSSNFSLPNSYQNELGSIFFFKEKNIKISFMNEKNKKFFMNNSDVSSLSLKIENDYFSNSFNDHFNSNSLNKLISFDKNHVRNTQTKEISNVKENLFSSLNQILDEKSQIKNVNFEIKNVNFEIKNAENIKESFNLTKLLNVLQMSVYYNSIFLNSFINSNNDSNKNHFIINEFTLNNPVVLNFTSLKSNTKLDAMLYKIYQKLPVQNYILCSLEHKIHKKALILAVKNTWDNIYKKAYINALKKVKKIKLKYNTGENLILPIAPVIENNSKLQSKQFSVLKKSEKFLPILNQSKNIQKMMVYKLGENLLPKILEKLKKNYRDYVLTILKKHKHPIFSATYTTLIHNDTNQMIFNVAKDIEKVLINETEWISTVLTQSLFKYLLFGNYLENMNFLNSNPLTISTNFTTSMFLDYYSNYVSNKKLETKRNNNLSIKPKHRKSYPLENPIYKKTTKYEKLYKENQKVFNTVYTLSHRERWETEKDWYIFTLFNSASVEYLDTPIAAYKKRLFSYSFDFVQESEAFMLSSSSLGHSPKGLVKSSEALDTKGTNKFSAYHVPQEILYSSSFYSGPGIVKQLLNEFDFNEIKKLDKQNRLLLYQLNKSIFKLKKQVQVFVYDKIAKNELKELCKKRDLLIRRTKLVRKLFRKDSNPSSMILTVLPVLPPDLRPIVKMGGQIAASDLNRLYQRVIYRNERLKKFLKDPATSQSYEMKYAQRLLQESVDNLIQNGKSGINSEKDARGRALKSLSDSLKGKQGRFRQFLLGKRVDYSGRSVIVVGPKLKLHECGLPIEMAKELYLPFLLKTILNKNYAKTVIGAKALIKKNPALTSELLREIMQVSPVLLNRAPTLHRLGFQAFVPKLIEGRAILLHPLVCSAFNADFDGDQMAVHVPITIEARAEAWKLMLSRNNILSPATGEPLAIPSQDMVLGCYYLTTYSNKGTIPLLKGSGVFFNNFEDVIRAYNQQKIHVHAFIWVKWTGLIENGSDQEEPLEIRLTSNGLWQEISANYYRIYDSNNRLVTQYVATTPGRVLFNLYITRNMK